MIREYNDKSGSHKNFHETKEEIEADQVEGTLISMREGYLANDSGVR